METKNQDSTKKRKPVNLSLTEQFSKLKKKVKSRSERASDLLEVEMAIMNVKQDLTHFNTDDMKEQRKILIETLTILFKKRKDLIKEL